MLEVMQDAAKSILEEEFGDSTGTSSPLKLAASRKLIQ